MSDISDIYNAFHTRIAAVLTTHKRLPNPYLLESNPNGYLRQGYAVSIGPGENTNRLIGCKIPMGRSFEVIISREYIATEFNPATMATTEKQLFEDQLLIIQDFYTDTTLGTGAFKTLYQSDSGVEFIHTQDESYVYVRTVFDIEYLEATS